MKATFDPLYKKTSTGAIQTWEIQVEGHYYGHHDHMDYDPAKIITTYGQVGGKMQTAVDEITEGKNLGKVNETTPFEQARAEAQSQWEKKQKTGYVQSIDDAQADKVDSAFVAGGVAPMLAHGFDKQGHKIMYPAYVQPKLDGHRCIAIIHDGVCTLWSRTQKRITGVPHIARQLESMFPNMNIILDGELYNHDYKDKFEELTSFIRSATPKPGHEVVQYHVYDVVVDGPFETRNEMLNMVKELAEAYEATAIAPVYTAVAADQDEMMTYFDLFVEQGFEGAIARNAAGVYKNKRSYDLQKIKEFDDAEFEVVRIEEGRGKMAGKALFVCQTVLGDEFRCKMVGDLNALAEYLVEPDKWIGKLLTVKFFGMTNGGVPRFPIGLRFREDV